MKKLFLVIIILEIVLLFSGCTSPKDDVQDILLAVLNNDKIFITENGEAVYLKNYYIAESQVSKPLRSKPTEYTFVDFNDDGISEMVINISNDYGAILILHYNGYDVYGYEYSIRSLHSLNTDGTFMASSGAGTVCYCRLVFENNAAKIIDIASADRINNFYEVDGKNCSVDRMNEFEEEWNLKRGVEWISHIPSNDDVKEYNENIDDYNDNDLNEQKCELINLNDYIVIEYDGYNCAGYAVVKIDKEKFLLDNKDKVEFNGENYSVYQELYHKSGNSAASEMLRYISFDIENNYRLQNGETICINFRIDTEKIDTYFVCDYIYESCVLEVDGLTEASIYDPFENIVVNFYGNEPYIQVEIFSYETGRDAKYELSQCDSLSNGDEVTVTYSCLEKADMISLYGEYPSCYEKKYVVNNMNKYVQSVDEIPNGEYEKLVKHASSNIWLIGYGNYSEAKYCGYFYYVAKEKLAHGVDFFGWCGMPVGNAICLVFEHPVEKLGLTDYDTEYTVIVYRNILIDCDGKLIYDGSEMMELRNGFFTYEDLYGEFIGTYDDIMYCTYNVNID